MTLYRRIAQQHNTVGLDGNQELKGQSIVGNMFISSTFRSCLWESWWKQTRRPAENISTVRRRCKLQSITLLLWVWFLIHAITPPSSPRCRGQPPHPPPLLSASLLSHLNPSPMSTVGREIWLLTFRPLSLSPPSSPFLSQPTLNFSKLY